MWIEKVKNGYRYVERYKDPLTLKYRRFTVTLDKDTRQAKKQAQEILSERIREFYESVPTQSKDYTLSDLVKAYRAYQEKTVKASTYKRNFFACDTLMRMLGADTLLSSINAGFIKRRFIASGKENDTLNEHLTRLKALIRWGYKNDYIEDIHFLDKIDRFKSDPHRLKIADKFLEREELAALTESMKVKIWRDLTLFIALSGLRVGEALALEQADVDLKERLIHVNKNYDHINEIVTSTKTETSCRDVYMQDELFPLCRHLKAERLSERMIGRPTDLFFSSDGGHLHYYAFNKYLSETGQQVLGRKITTHTLRHTHASLLMEQGVDIATISRRLGHADSKITKEIYLHVTKKIKQQDETKLKYISILKRAE